MSRRSRCVGIVVIALVTAQVGCARPSWMKMPDLPDMPDVDMPDLPMIELPSLGGSDGPARSSEVEIVESNEVTDFYGRASEFYRRLEGRRFNSIASFRDAGLREYFGSDQSFVDYYADLADDLSTASFERSVPLRTDVQEFLVDAPGRARVKVRIVGEDGRPLRFWAASVEREDRWERRDGRWWIVPGRS
jgi:hypothetical protein